MANEIQFKRGNNEDVASANALAGEPMVALDTETLLIGKEDGTAFEVGIKETSKLVNDAGFVNKETDVLENYYLNTTVDEKIATAVDGVQIPTKTSELTNDNNFITVTEVDTKISSAVASAVMYKGTVATFDDLPNDANNGELYDVQETGDNYIWNAVTQQWDKQAGTIDLSNLATKTEIQAIEEQIDSIEEYDDTSIKQEITDVSTEIETVKNRIPIFF